MWRISSLWKAAVVNQRNKKSATIPILNVFDIYGRNFLFAWLGFLVCFLSWFGVPPLMTKMIKRDLKLTAVDIANNNICGLSATLLGRFVMGPVCDRYGPRWGMISILLIGAIPTAFMPLVNNVSGLHAIRFFISILGSSFVCCAQYVNAFFDNNIIGTANAVAAGWGNSGAGIAFFVMPAIASALLNNDGYSLHKAWSLSFVIGPFLILLFVAFLLLFFGQDCPMGKWSRRSDILGVNQNNTLIKTVSLSKHGKVLSITASAVGVTGVDDPAAANKILVNKDSNDEKKYLNDEAQDSEENDVDIEDLISKDEIIRDPTFWDVAKISFAPRTLLCALPYLTTFGTELAVESILSALYEQHEKLWPMKKAGDWASMMGLLNVVTRPLGGFISDILYHHFKSTKAKKFWMLFCGVVQGIFLIWIGFRPHLSIAGLITALSFMALFMEMANGANFAVVPFINKAHTGLISGSTGAFGNAGGIFFSLVFRFTIVNGKNNYFRGFWIIGICSIVVNLAVCLIPIREERPKKIRTEMSCA